MDKGRFYRAWGGAILGAGLGAVSMGRAAEAGRAYYLMGTVVRIHSRAASEEIAQSCLQAGFETVKRLDDLLSSYKEDSEISRINRSTGGAVAVSSETWQALAWSVEMASRTVRAFDPTVGPLIEAWGLRDLAGRWPTDKEIRTILSSVDYRRISLSRIRDEYFARLQPPSRIDLGGIGKGYAADLAVKAMEEAGGSSGWIDIGGQLSYFGPAPSPEGWEVHIAYPTRRDESGRAEDYVRSIHVPTGSSVATSSLAERSVQIRGFEKVRIGHILDPRTGYPAGWRPDQGAGDIFSMRPTDSWLESVTVVASSGAMEGFPGTLADALATAVFVEGAREGLNLASAFAGAEALVVFPGVEGLQVRTTPGWKRFEK